MTSGKKKLTLAKESITEFVDGTADGMRRFLAELSALAGQSDPSHAAPVLELELDHIVTRATLVVQGETTCLMVVARAQKVRPSRKSALREHSSYVVHALGRTPECAWDVDEGRHVVIRSVAVVDVKNERMALDFILETADAARSYLG